ncbi:hypothetical protein LQW54_006896 [Pestalotiopsis sp. IQ-011]
MQYQSSVMIHHEGKKYLNTYLDVFSNEVLRITHAIDKCYSSFRKDLGKSEKSFGNLTEDATTCLMDINDVQHEIGIIRQILKHRSQAWKELHDNPPKARKGSQTSESAFRRPCCSWGIETCDPSSISDFSYGDIDRIEKDAVRVQKKDKIQKLLKTDDLGKLVVEQMQKLKSRKDTKKKD